MLSYLLIQDPRIDLKNSHLDIRTSMVLLGFFLEGCSLSPSESELSIPKETKEKREYVRYVQSNLSIADYK